MIHVPLKRHLWPALGACALLAVLIFAAVWSPDPAGSRTREATRLYDRGAGQAFLASLPVGDRERVIKLKSRWFLPGTRLERARDGHQVFVQFKHWLTANEKCKLAKDGVLLGAPLGAHAYRARLDDGAWPKLKDHPEFDGIAEVKPVDKLPEPIYDMPSDGGEALVALEPAPGADLTRLHFVRRRVRRHGRALVVRLTVPEIRKLAKRDEIAYVHLLGQIPIAHNLPASEIDKDCPDSLPAPENADAATVHNIGVLHGGAYNLDGTGVVVGEVDASWVRATHEALTGRITNVETDSAGHWHSTHVAGTIIGNPPGTPAAMGMAPAATLASYDYDNDLNGAVGVFRPHQKIGHARANYGITVHNNSWGYVGGWYFNGATWVFSASGYGIFGDYDWYSQQWDQAVVDNPKVVVCKSSGNDRSDHDPGDVTDHDGTLYVDASITNPYYDCIADTGVAKNIISVGATVGAGAITTFSSIGPADDGRIKPDLVADGSGLTSATNTADDAYTSASGTSMASPVVAGAGALIVQAWHNEYAGADPDAMVVKALLVQTATDLGRAGPDYVYGFGLVDAQAAVDVLQTNAGGALRIVQGSVADAAMETYTIPGVALNAEVTVTLTWLDPAGDPAAANAIVHDLDVELEDPDGVTHFPFQLDPANPVDVATNAAKNAVDTVELAKGSGASAGTWTVRVKGASIASGPQDFVLVASHEIASGDPMISLSTGSLAPTVAEGNDATAQSFTVRNSGVGTLNYAITVDQAWLDVDTANGTSTGEADTVNLTYDTDALAHGTYNATITVSDGAAPNSPRTIAVSLVVQGPVITLNTSSLSTSVTEGNDASAQSFTVTNSGVNTLSYTITDSANWLSVSPAAGTSSGEADPITVNYNTNGLNDGSYSATITITDAGAENSPRTVSIALTVKKKKSSGGGGGGGGGGGCGLAGGPPADACGASLPYLAILGLWLASRLRRRRRY